MRFRLQLSLVGLTLAALACADARAAPAHPTPPSAAIVAPAPDESTAVVNATLLAPIPLAINVAEQRAIGGFAHAIPEVRRPQSSATRPADSLLFNAMQTDLKSLAWRQSDGKYRATSHSGTAGTWEINVRDAVWRALFATTQ